MNKHFLRNLSIPIIGVILALTLIPAAVFAVDMTAAGTQITNTASVTWSGITVAAPTASATVTVELLPTAPNVAYVSTTPGTIVGAASAVTMTYTVTSAANGTDTYDLDLSSLDSANLSAPTFAGTNPTTVSVGASMALNPVVASNTVVIPGLVVSHGLAALETVLIGGTPYTVSAVADDGTNTTLTLSGAVTMAAGDMIYEQRTLTFDMTTGTFTGGSVDETHALTLTATSQADAGQIGSVANPTITVARATLGIAKTADSDPLTAGNQTTAQPGDTITYTITVTNGGTSSAANVTVTDATPVFTTYVVGSGTYKNDVGPDTAFTEADIAAGLNVGSLAAGKSVVISFQVTVD